MRKFSLKFLPVISVSIACAGNVANSHAEITTYRQNFDGLQFRGAPVLLNDSNENWQTADYYNIMDSSEWSFGPGAYWTTDRQGNGAVLLNEDGGTTGGTARLDLRESGFLDGQLYELAFDVFGDNRPGEIYGFTVLAGSTIYALDDQTVGLAGTNAGNIASSHRLVFTFNQQTSDITWRQNTPQGSAASPIIDNVFITAVPEPSISAMLGLGLALCVSVAIRKNAT
jgi:hypothetical protein